MQDHIIIGKITGAHGVRGEVKVLPLTDDAHRFLKLKECYFCTGDLKDLKAVSIRSSRLDRGNVLIHFEGIDDRDIAQALHGTFIAVSRENAVSLKKDSYYIADLIGLTVIDDEKGDAGKVCDCYETGANYILEVKRPGKKMNLLIPFLKIYCYEVNPEEGFIKCRMPKGLYELYE